jgi:hypothetical protein
MEKNAGVVVLGVYVTYNVLVSVVKRKNESSLFGGLPCR